MNFNGVINNRKIIKDVKYPVKDGTRFPVLQLAGEECNCITAKYLQNAKQTPNCFMFQMETKKMTIDHKLFYEIYDNYNLKYLS